MIILIKKNLYMRLKRDSFKELLSNILKLIIKLNV